jgi:Ribosomal protein L16p/L10e
MRGAWGKPYGTVARVNIGQIILSIRCKDNNAPVIMEALRRARYKFPGRQKIIVSKKWGFTNVDKGDYLKLKEEKKVLQCVYIYIDNPSTNERHFLGMELTCNSFDPKARLSRTFETNFVHDRLYSQAVINDHYSLLRCDANRTAFIFTTSP